MFQFTRKPSSGSHSQYLAKITGLVQCGYMEVMRTSVLRLHSMTVIKLYSHNTDDVCTNSM